MSELSVKSSALDSGKRIILDDRDYLILDGFGYKVRIKFDPIQGT